MELPQIAIPKAIIESIPTDQIPTLMHPPLVHFAIVLPIMVILLELVNIIVKRGETPEQPKGKGVSTLSFILIVAMVVIFFAAYVSGSVDGKATWDILGDAGQAELKEHKLIGTYLVYGSLLLLVLKIIATVAGGKSRVLLLLFALLFAAATLKQGKDGGELVYEFGANVERVKALDDKVFDLEDELDTLKSASAPTMEDKNSTVSAAAVTPATPVAAEDAIEGDEEGDEEEVAADTEIQKPTAEENATH